MSTKLTEILAEFARYTNGYIIDKHGLDKAEKAINAYIAEIIGNDSPTRDLKSTYQNELRREQRKRAGL